MELTRLYFGLLLAYFWKFHETTLVIFHLDKASVLYLQRLNTALPMRDPLDTYTLQERQVICDQVLTAKTFTHLPRNQVMPPDVSANADAVDLATENFQRFAVSPDDPEPSFLAPRKRTVRVRSGWQNLNPDIHMFQCVNKPEEKLFVTFGLRENEMFLIQLVRDARAHQYLKMIGIIEPSSSFNAALWIPRNVNHLSNYFMEQIRTAGVLSTNVFTVPANMKIHFYTSDNHVRVCGSVFEAMSAPHNNYFARDIRKVNYIRPRFRDMVVPFRVHVGFQQYMISNVGFIPCCVNRDDKIPQFFLLADPGQQRAVLVFRELPYMSNELFVIGRVEGVGALIDTFEDVDETSTSRDP